MIATDISFFSAILIGIAGSVHCVGMCGGIVSAFSFLIPKNNAPLPYILAYNIGRIMAYTLAGAIVGFFGARLGNSFESGMHWLQLISGIFLLLMALYIGNWWRILTRLESAGQLLWRLVQPLSKRFTAMKSPFYALPYGFIWGWLPCGLVYSTLTWSMASGSWHNGALTMMAFGLGTLPSMVFLGSSAVSIKKTLSKVYVRQGIALILLVFSLMILLQATDNIVS